MELLLGAGSSRAKLLSLGDRAWGHLVTLDINQDHNPDVVHDLEILPYPFDDDAFDEIHAYEVMEHIGRQGDWRFFFAQWAEIYRILKPGGVFFGTSPAFDSPWAWGDPGHTRIINQECLCFLSQPNYAQVGKTAMTDYRFVWKGDFDVIYSRTEGHTYQYGLKAIKPARES